MPENNEAELRVEIERLRARVGELEQLKTASHTLVSDAPLTTGTATSLRALAEADLLNRTATAVSSDTDINRILTTALEYLHQLLDFTGGSVALVEGDELVIRAAYGTFAANALGQRMKRGKGRSWQVIETGEPFFVADLQATTLKATNPLRSYLAVPLKWRGEIFGLLEVDSTEPNRFTELDLALMQKMALVLSGPIEIARQYELEARSKAEVKAAQLTLQQSEANLRAVFDSAKQSIMLLDPACRLIAFNRSLEESTRQVLDKPVVVGQSYLDLVLPDNYEGFKRHFETALAGASINAEIEIAKANGEQSWWEFYYSPIKLGSGEVTGVLLMANDISYRKKAEIRMRFLAEASATLTSSLDYHQTLLSLTRLVVPQVADGCAVDIQTEEGQLERLAASHINPATEALLRDYRQRFSFDSSRPGPLMRVLQSGQPWFQPELRLDKVAEEDLSTVSALTGLGLGSALIVPLRYHEKVLGVITLGCVSGGRRFSSDELTLALDLADRAALAVENALLYREAQRSIESQQRLDRLKDQFLSIASHELRTPLTAIRGYGQILQNEFYKRYSQPISEMDSEKFQRSYNREMRIITNLVYQTMRMAELIDEMLDISRIQSGQFELRQEGSVDLRELVERIITQHLDTATDRKIMLETEQSDFKGKWDEARLEQVIHNLLNNAIKYSPAGSPVIIRLTHRNNAGIEEVVGSVQDQGSGISPEQQKYIFERFYRAQSEGWNSVDGLGLGLFISREIITRSGGSMWVESEPGQGSTFYFSLPISST
ncbi:MAG TPA: GAF domain-containing protein [Chloroflexia bacterium]|nr:GAF domain-containing protein [Chloroflexia bacterium]